MNNLNRYNQSHQEHLIIEACSLPDYRKEVLAQYSPEHIHSTLAELQSQTYNFGTHTLKLAEPIQSHLNCNECNRDTFAENTPIVLLHCRHVAHKNCSYTGGCIAMPCCRRCNESSGFSFMQEYGNASDFLDKTELACIHDECSFTLRHHALHQPRSDKDDALLKQAVQEEFEKLGARIVVNYVKKLNDQQMLPVNMSDFQPFERALSSEIINALPGIQLPAAPVNHNQYIDVGAESCPSPISSFKNEPAKGFLDRHQQYLTGFIHREFGTRRFYSNYKYRDDTCASYKNDIGITVDCSHFVNISPIKISYRPPAIETGSTGADAFRTFKKLFYTDLAILDLWYSPSTHAFYEREGKKPYLCQDWDAAADTITIKKGDREAELKLSNFVDYARKTVDRAAFEMEVNQSGFSYQALIN